MPNTQFFICKLWQIVKDLTTFLWAATGRPNVYVFLHIAAKVNFYYNLYCVKMVGYFEMPRILNHTGI